MRALPRPPKPPSLFRPRAMFSFLSPKKKEAAPRRASAPGLTVEVDDNIIFFDDKAKLEKTGKIIKKMGMRLRVEMPDGKQVWAESKDVIELAKDDGAAAAATAAAAEEAASKAAAEAKAAADAKAKAEKV